MIAGRHWSGVVFVWQGWNTAYIRHFLAGMVVGFLHCAGYLACLPVRSSFCRQDRLFFLWCAGLFCFLCRSLVCSAAFWFPFCLLFLQFILLWSGWSFRSVLQKVRCYRSAWSEFPRRFLLPDGWSAPLCCFAAVSAQLVHCWSGCVFFPAVKQEDGSAGAFISAQRLAFSTIPSFRRFWRLW